MIEVLTVMGTRPEAIKMAPVIRELRRRSARFAVRVCSTGQHREMLPQALEPFGIAPDIDLDIMHPEQTPSQVAARVLQALEPVLAAERPEWVLVQGDTTTVMATALCAHHNRIRVGHVEAGLRSFDRANPFPEEMNRIVTDHVSDLHFAPTEWTRQNLLREGFSAATIRVTGNPVIDALQWMVQQPTRPSTLALLEDLGLGARQRPSQRRLILVTAHRRENFGGPLAGICSALRTLARRDDVHVVYPVHRNPQVWEPVHTALAGVDGISLLPPVDYPTLVELLRCCTLVLTDSGGIQEEAPALGKPVLVLRQVTERPEGVETGTARVVGTDPVRIVAETLRLLDDHALYRAMARAVNPYGDGQAARRIVQALESAAS
jgi:UDP-N-acetylglucosamine 2-epimerase (non-hydrolysing)